MSKSDDKIRPIQERLAQIEGSTTFKDLREGFGGFANITNLDLMAGLAIVRTAATKDADDYFELAPEILETYFGSTQMYRRALVRGYLGEHRVQPQYITAHRMGATLGAQMMAGISFSREQDAEFAFICNVRLMTLLDLRATALKWYQGLLDKAIPLFGEALRQIVGKREFERRAAFIEASARNEEDRRREEEKRKIAESDQVA
jgi:hypothetical protein